MMKRFVLFCLILCVCAGASSALSWEFGGVAGGGLDFAFGTYFDAKAAQLAALGSSGPGSLGTSRFELLPGATLGGYAELELLDWLAVRVEPRVSFLGAAFMAYTDAGAPFDRYGSYFFAALLPLYLRGGFEMGPGALQVAAGGFCGLGIGGVAFFDRYVSSTTNTWMSLRLDGLLFFGVSGGIGYSLPLGPGTASIELRADWALTPVTLDDGTGIDPLGMALVFSYGIGIGGAE
jgi:hypothetical protein